MHIDIVPNRNSRPAYLLRESVRDGKRVGKRTLANLSSLPVEQIEVICRVLKGERLGRVEDGLECVGRRRQVIRLQLVGSILPRARAGDRDPFLNHRKTAAGRASVMHGTG